mgnify:CR=1 FL=1
MSSKNTRYVTLAASALIGSTLAFGTGCKTNAQSGALIGSGIGAGAGAAIDHRNRGRGALIGAGVGAVGGYFTGNEFDKKKQRDEDAVEEY